MKNMIIELFGPYVPVVYATYVTTEVEGTPVTELVEVVPSGVAGLDWPWIMGVFLFSIVLWSLFRLLGVFFK